MEQLGLDPDAVIDFSVNSNPYGASAAVRAAAAAVPLERYPDRECLALRRELANHIPFVDMQQIVVGNGTAELMLLIALAYIQPGDAVCIVAPTFSEYARVSSLMGAWVETYTARPEDSFVVDLNAVEAMLERVKPRLLFFCTPNNPTGLPLDAHQIFRLAERFPDTLFVSDEAYFHFVWNVKADWSMERYIMPNVLVLRSMTKDFGLAGLRLGYAFGDSSVIRALAQARPAWNVNAVAQAAGVAALQDRPYLTRTLLQLREERDTLVDGLCALGLPPLPTSTHYFLVQVGDAAGFRRALLSHSVMVRDCTSFGLPDYVRISTRKAEDNALLLTAIKQVLEAQPFPNGSR